MKGPIFSLILGVFTLALPSPAQSIEPFNTNAVWRYLKGTNEAASPDRTAWRAVDFDDSTWLTGPGAFYFGETLAGTLLSDMQSRYSCVFLRRTFEVSNLTEIVAVQFGAYSDDGYIAWLNGQELRRFNVPAGEPIFTTVASTAVETSNSVTTVTTPADELVEGTNVLAVQAFNQSLSGGGDFVFDAYLRVYRLDTNPPLLTAVSPPAGTVSNLTHLTLIFSESVANVDATDLLINDAPALTLTNLGSNAYRFGIAQPSYGRVRITWNPGHGIRDLAFSPNAFNATGPGATWEYDFVDVEGPAVAALVPEPGALLSRLAQIEVVFSEEVTGVDATDLLINGVPASGVASLQPSQYFFYFDPPATGQVQMAWAQGHGIRDLAATPNAFGGGAWAYRLDTNVGAADLLITEFMAANDRTWRDEDGAFADWIEIHNAGSTPANLEGWYLTDSAGNLKKWRFPTTWLNAGGYRIVFASEKDRRTPGAPLHTNFRLSNNGEYLALVKPDGVTVVSEYAPAFPPQVTDVSYGLPTASEPTVLLTTGALARVLVPRDGSLGLSWVQPLFNDALWPSATNGIGFQASTATPSLAGSFLTDVRSQMLSNNSSAYLRIPFLVSDPGAFDILRLRVKYDDGFVAYLNGAEVARRNAPRIVATVADSATEFSANQGQGNWTYGYYAQSVDSDSQYQIADFTLFPSAGGPFSPTNFWGGTNWNWFGGDPPWTEVSRNSAHPNGDSNGQVHWAIRRWTSEVTGTLNLRIRSAKLNVTCGNGVTLRVFHNGIEVFSRLIAFTENTVATNQVVIPNAVQGDLIDFAIGPEGTDGTAHDGCDNTLCTVIIEQITELPPEWNTRAASARSNSLAVVYEDIDISPQLVGLSAGLNFLAIHGLNVTTNDGDFLIAAELETRVRGLQRGSPRYFTASTPGRANGYGVETLGPVISDVQHTPPVPRDEEDIFVTARLTPAFAPLANVQLRYRVMFGGETNLPLRDDGLSSDGAAGDGVFGARIPAASITVPGQMIRWFIEANDTQGRASRYPPFAVATNSPQYLGAMVYLAQTNNLPVLHLFMQTPGAAETDAGTRTSVFYHDEFYDNVGISIHGQSSRGFPKKSYDIDFNPGANFLYDPNEARVDDLNLLTTWPDKAHMRNMLAYETYRDADGPAHFAFPVRVQLNGTFWQDAHIVENGDENFLARIGLDPNGAFYKMYNTFQSTADTTIGSGAAEKKTRKNEGSADLVALVNGLSLSGQALQSYMYDNLNIPEVVNFLAAKVITADVDCCHKNYYFYRDTEGTGEWQMLPWDVDLSFGRTWNEPNTYFDDKMYPSNYYNGGNPLYIGNNNKMPSAIFNTPATKQMYLRRIRTLMDELQQPPGMSPYLLRYEQRIDQLAGLIGPDAALDLARWSTWGQRQTLTQAVDIMKTLYMEPRRSVMYASFSVTNRGEIPLGQPTNAFVRIGAIEYNPASHQQAEEYIQLVNTNSYAVDISGWQLTGGIHFSFRGGTVLASNSVLYVSPDLRAFRARKTGPSGGQRLLVVGPYAGQLSARGESLWLIDKAGRLVHSNSYPATPSLAQQYLRITELMYHPAPPPSGSPYSAEELEYLELKNTGPVPLNLTGVRFLDGIEFAFTGDVTNLASGQSILLVKNVAAFSARYGTGRPVVGQFLGQLDNNGERVRMVDADNEEILDFTYRDRWYPVTDGLGFSLVVVDEAAEPDAWDFPSNWRPSGLPTGSPGENDPPPTTVPAIVVNEVLANSSAPRVDAIELYNPTTNTVDLSGWFLSDDFTTPMKFRIPNGTLLPSGRYRVLDESAFNANPALPQSFAFSSLGDEAYVFSGNPAGTNLTGYYHGFDFGPSASNVSFGRHLTSVGEEHFVAQRSLTLEAANAGPQVGPIVISEIMYHPPDGAGGADNTADEFLELHNISAEGVRLFDPSRPTNTWRLRDAVDFDFPATNVTLAAGGYLVIVSFPPTNAQQVEAFRAKHGVPVDVPVFGPYAGKLDNSDERVELLRPEEPLGAQVPYVLADQVHYHDDGDWPREADGLGASLQRRSPGAYGDDPASWFAAAPAPGTRAAPGDAPVVTAQPQDATTVIARSAVFAVTATGAPALRYQWRFNGASLAGATNSVLVLENVQLKHAGAYSVVVFNAGGTVFSSNALLEVKIPAYLSRQPVNQSVRLGTNASFSVSATSTTPLRYQWRRNGVDIPGATNAGYTISRAGFEHVGTYDVWVRDDVSALLSESAQLRVLVEPVIVQHPQSVTAVTGSIVRLSASVTNAATLPVTYRWRRAGLTFTNMTLNEYTSTLTIPSLQAGTAGPFSVVVTNEAYITPGYLSSNAHVTAVVPPLDQAVRRGETATFSVFILPANTNKFAWQFNGLVLPNLSTNVLTVTNAQPLDEGTYTVTITNAGGQLARFSAQLVIDTDQDGLPDSWERAHGLNPSDPSDALLDADGDSMSNLAEAIAGTDPRDAHSYLWLGLDWQGNARLHFYAMSNRPYTVQFKESLVASRWFNLADVAAEVTNRMVALSDPYPPTLGRIYRLTTPLQPETNLGPVILQSPQSTTVAVTETARLDVVAAGDGPVFYQWQSNQVNLPGRTNLWLEITNIAASAAGQYAVVLRDRLGTLRSDAAKLRVSPLITFQPEDQAAAVGQPVTFRVEAIGASPLRYRWHRNHEVLAGQTNAVLLLPSVQASDAASYHVVVSHQTPLGPVSTVSRAARLSVPP